MTTDRPAPGSPWAVRCPDAYPYEWYAALGLSTLPPGFTRFATDDEAALIAGTITEADFRLRTGRKAAPSPTVPPESRRQATGGRFGLLNGFVDFELHRLTRGEVKVWLILFRDTRDGIARTGQVDIARRAGITPRGVRKALKGLAGKGLVTVVLKGRLGTGPSSYRVLGMSLDPAR
ncbi:MAG: transcriptional regulator [Gemmataceae bacterium]|nr:transcriptional regulator [Gemmataceae bacterium]